MAITALPTPPSRQRPTEFSNEADAFLGALPSFGTEANALATEVNLNAESALSSKNAATLSESNAALSEANASISEVNAALSESNALTSANNSESSAIQASKLNLGSKVSPPALDNQGQPLLTGATYYDTTLSKWRVWSGVDWADGISAIAGVSTVNGRNGVVTGLLEKTGDNLTGALNEAPSIAVASAATINVGSVNSNTVTITGTTGITSFGTATAGVIRRLVFDNVLTLTHNGTSLILPGATNITTVAGDVAELLSLGGGNWRCVSYQRASGQSVASVSGGVYLNKLVTQSSTSFVVPSGVYKIRAYAGGKGGDGMAVGGETFRGAGSG